MTTNNITKSSVRKAVIEAITESQYKINLNSERVQKKIDEIVNDVLYTFNEQLSYFAENHEDILEELSED